MNPHRNALVFGAFALAAGAAACSGADATGADASAPVTLTLQRATSAGLQVASLSFDGGPAGRPAVLDTALVDSIIVTVEAVQLAPARHDSLGPGMNPDHRRPGMGGGPGHPGRPPHDSLRPPHDSLRPPHDSLWPPHDSLMGGSARGPRFDWYTLTVVSGGRIDLMHLPTETDVALVLATGDVPPGDYQRVRLVVSEGYIWLNTEIVTPQGDTLPANTAIPVVFPTGGIMVAVEFTVPEGGGDIPLVFDAAETFAHVLVTGDGRVIVTPVMRHRHGPPLGP